MPGDRAHRRRRPVDAAGRGEELRVRAAVCGPADYEPCSRSCAPVALARDAPPARGGGVRAHRRLRRRDRDVVQRREPFPDSLVVSLEKELDLAYGENPHQRAAYYAERGVRRHLLSRVEQLHGKELSFNNLNDLSGARSLAREFALPACVIVKHANPCGVAVGATSRGGVRQGARLRPDQRVRRRRRPQPRGRGAARGEARGAVRRGPVRARLHRGRARRAAAEEEHADPPRRRAPLEEPGERHYKRVLGGMLVQDSDAEIEDRDGWERRHRRAERAAVGRPRLRMARLQARRVERDRAREGPADDRDRRRPDEPRRRGAHRGREGGGVRPRPDRLRRSPRTRSSRSPTARRSRSTRASTAIVQPGGSRRDEEVIAAVSAAGAAMAFTGRRHFRH